MWQSDTEREHYIQTYGLKAIELLEEYRALPEDAYEERYRFLNKHEKTLGELAGWEAWIVSTPIEERIRIEEKLREEGLI